MYTVIETRCIRGETDIINPVLTIIVLKQFTNAIIGESKATILDQLVSLKFLNRLYRGALFRASLQGN